MRIEARVGRGRGVWAALLALLLVAPAVALAVPAAVPYEGTLTHEDGTLFEGLVDVEMGLYTSAGGGSALWGPTLFPDVSVEGGVLSVVLGEAPGPVLDGSVLAGGDVWLEVTVDGVVLTPRQRVLSVPFALRAGDAERLGGEPASAFVTESSLPTLGVLSIDDVGAATLSNAYGDLAGTPDLSVFLRADGTVALTGPWDLGGQALENVVIGTSAAPPEGAAAGQLWWDSEGAVLKVYTGTAWVTAGGGAEGVATSLQ